MRREYGERRTRHEEVGVGIRHLSSGSSSGRWRWSERESGRRRDWVRAEKAAQTAGRRRRCSSHRQSHGFKLWNVKPLVGWRRERRKTNNRNRLLLIFIFILTTKTLVGGYWSTGWFIVRSNNLNTPFCSQCYFF